MAVHVVPLSSVEKCFVVSQEEVSKTKIGCSFVGVCVVNVCEDLCCIIYLFIC